MTDWLPPLLLGPGWGLISQLLPCPLAAGWTVQQDLPLPGPGGGYSAIQMEPATHRVWLLSDLPEGELSSWTLPLEGRQPRRIRSLQLQVPPSVTQQLDSEGLVIEADQAWIATEGRRSRERAPQLLRFSLSNGNLQASFPLPPAWQQGLESNAGPESLARLSRSSEPLALLMAAERPLRQDPADQVRLLRWHWPAGRDPQRDPCCIRLGHSHPCCSPSGAATKTPCNGAINCACIGSPGHNIWSSPCSSGICKRAA
ncbi:MAG: hypothetical protein EBZ29_02855 [Synechococcaceae bacterium WB9_4xC_028]|nr:hypothetical protein [Synechococcaceae bacterium WB9_4xC_028]